MSQASPTQMVTVQVPLAPSSEAATPAATSIELTLDAPEAQILADLAAGLQEQGETQGLPPVTPADAVAWLLRQAERARAEAK